MKVIEFFETESYKFKGYTFPFVKINTKIFRNNLLDSYVLYMCIYIHMLVIRLQIFWFEVL